MYHWICCRFSTTDCCFACMHCFVCFNSYIPVRSADACERFQTETYEQQGNHKRID